MVPQPESIADHMYRLTLILYTLLPYTNPNAAPATATNGTGTGTGTGHHHHHHAQPHDQQQSLLMSLTHDMAECIAGDITPTEYSGISKADKHKREADAMHLALTHLPPGQRSEVHSLWHEYEADESELSRLLHDCDKLEMVVQAFEYERRSIAEAGSVSGMGGLKGRRSLIGIGSGQKGLDRFYESVKKIRDERVKQVAHEVLRRRHAELLDGLGSDCVDKLDDEDDE